ncbi:MAG: AAA family ATPase [Janthinobacterium lividum]
MAEATKMLTHLRVKGFRSIADLDIAIRPLNVLIGANGAGKSNFINLFRFVREIVDERLQLYTGLRGGADRILHYGRKTTKALEIQVDFPPNGYGVKLLPSANDRFVFAEEYGAFQVRPDNPNPYAEDLVTAGATESGLAAYTRRWTYGVGHHVYRELQNWRVYHFHDTSSSAPVKQSTPRNDTLVLREDAANLAAILWQLQEQQPLVYRLLVRTIQLVVPLFQDFLFRPGPDIQQSVCLEWQDKNQPDTVFNAHDLSDGSLRFICLATLLLQPTLPKVVLLDEPELGLHPAAIAALAGLLRRASDRATVLVATQSVNLVNEFDPEDIIVVERDAQGASTFTRQTAEQLTSWLERYSLGELWEKNVLGGRP